MSMTDPIADLLTRVRNAMMAKHDNVDVPASRMKVEIVKILKDEGYIDDFTVRDNERQGVITVQLKYQSDGSRTIVGLERVSRPGRRVYRGKDEIPSVLNGLGITILSTSRGVLTGSTCRKLGVGGEVLCNVW
jgi:small subunit ribosomal protein S8